MAPDAAIRKALKKGDLGNIRRIATTHGVGTVQQIKAEMSAAA
jgi:hypothetical protein